MRLGRLAKWIAVWPLVAGGLLVPASKMLAQPALPAGGNGHVTTIFVEPEGTIVFGLTGLNPCGGLFVLPRANANHREYYAALLLAFSSQVQVWVNVVECHGDRNILSHGNIWRG